MDTKQNMAKQENPNLMKGKRHSLETKKKISTSQKMRYQAIRKAIEEQNDLLQYTQTDSEARRVLFKNLISNNTLSLKNIQQAVNFIAIMLSEQTFQDIIKEGINKFVASSDTYCNIKKEQM